MAFSFMTNWKGDRKNPDSAWWTDKENGNNEYPDWDQQNAEGREGQDGAETAANPSQGNKSRKYCGDGGVSFF